MEPRELSLLNVLNGSIYNWKPLLQYVIIVELYKLIRINIIIALGGT